MKRVYFCVLAGFIVGFIALIAPASRLILAALNLAAFLAVRAFAKFAGRTFDDRR